MEVSRPRLGLAWRALVGSAQACSNWWRGSGQRWRLGVAMAVVALLLGSVLATPAGRAVATELLGQFRVQKFALITVAPQDPTANFASLEQLGTLHVPEDMQEEWNPGNQRCRGRGASRLYRPAALAPAFRPVGRPAGPHDAGFYGELYRRSGQGPSLPGGTGSLRRQRARKRWTTPRFT